MSRPLWIAALIVTTVLSGAAGGLVVSAIDDNGSEYAAAVMIEEKIEASNAALRQDWESLVGPAIETYLLNNPSILERVTLALSEQRQAEQLAASRQLISANSDIIFGGEGTVSIGNPDGDVTLVEMYDYNCEYCRRAFPDIVTLVDQDPNLRVVLRQFPILSQGSVDAAKIGLLVRGEGADYWAYHQAMFTARGQVDLEVALRAAASLGLEADRLRASMEEPTVVAALEESYELARKLGISGTPTFILADEIIPGAVGVDVLREKIANVRACGSTACETSGRAPEIVLPPTEATTNQ